jgi:hypothetical protein
VPEIKGGVFLLPSVRVTKAAGHVNRVIKVDFLSLKKLSRQGAVKSVDDTAGNMFWNRFYIPVNGRANRPRQFKLMDFAQNKIVLVMLRCQVSGQLVFFVFLIQKADEKTCVAIDNHSRSSMMIVERFVLLAGPVGGISLSSLSSPSRMLFSPVSIRFNSKTFPLRFLT